MILYFPLKTNFETFLNSTVAVSGSYQTVWSPKTFADEIFSPWNSLPSSCEIASILNNRRSFDNLFILRGGKKTPAAEMQELLETSIIDKYINQNNMTFWSQQNFLIQNNSSLILKLITTPLLGKVKRISSYFNPCLTIRDVKWTSSGESDFQNAYMVFFF